MLKQTAGSATVVRDVINNDAHILPPSKPLIWLSHAHFGTFGRSEIEDTRCDWAAKIKFNFVPELCTTSDSGDLFC